MIDRSKQITLLWNSLVLPNYTESFTEIKTNNFQYRENSYMDDYKYFIKPTITCVSKYSKEYLNEHFSPGRDRTFDESSVYFQYGVLLNFEGKNVIEFQQDLLGDRILRFIGLNESEVYFSTVKWELEFPDIY